ncbi:MAG: hypothetical protein JXB23_07095 [Candidatus Aminicenantes bacterium]|nr:hypothetical protein [Candidatus Aminicenantes bacterium]
MLTCKIAGILFSTVPIKRWQAFVIEHHIGNCPFCREQLAEMDEVKSLLIKEDRQLDSERMWSSFLSRMTRRTKPAQPFFTFRWKWVYGLAVTVAAIAAVLFIREFALRNEIPDGSDVNGHFQINYVQIGDRPARVFVYKPVDSDMIIIWAQKNMTGE